MSLNCSESSQISFEGVKGGKGASRGLVLSVSHLSDNGTGVQLVKIHQAINLYVHFPVCILIFNKKLFKPYKISLIIPLN